MKRAFVNTRTAVKLRKAENREELYLYIESYPVYEAGKEKPIRVREYVNRTITTPVWDKKKTTRGSSGKKTAYMPKRDINGIILCKSSLDQEACIYADRVRNIRQKEYETKELYSEADAAMAEQVEKSRQDFLTYFRQEAYQRHKYDSDSIFTTWLRVYDILKEYSNNEPIIFADISLNRIEKFKQYLLTLHRGGGKEGTVSQNTASSYFGVVKAALKQAFIDGYLQIDISAKTKNIPTKESRREHLTLEELNTLANTTCDTPIIKRAALFSALTGLRHCDIQKMKWKELDKEIGHHRINFTQKKTQGVEYMPISEQAYKLCGEPGHPDELVFGGLPAPSWISKPLERLIEASGIKKHITFHCFRHTYATLQLANGTDIFTVSKMLGHTNVRTTQIYAKVVDKKKEDAADAIQLNTQL